MFRAPSQTLHGLLTAVLLILLAEFSGGCVDRTTLADVQPGGSKTLLSLDPDLIHSLQSPPTPAIVQIRVVSTIFETDQMVAFSQVPVDPDASAWTVELEVTLPPGSGAQLELTVELLSESLAVEWSGHSGPFTVTPGETTQITLGKVVRGPLDNLSVTGLTITAPSTLRIPRMVDLGSTVTAADPGATPVIFWTSLTPQVGRVNRSGRFQALAEGTAQVVAVAGPVSDTVNIQVLPALAGLDITPAEVSFRNFGDHIVFQTRIYDTHGNTVANEPLTWAVDPPDRTVLDYNDGENDFVGVGNGTAKVTATVITQSNIFASAQVTVRQLADFVDVFPVEVTLGGVGETVQFSADPHDANGNPVRGATFDWWVQYPSVATLDQNGLATAQGAGTTLISAQVLEPSDPSGAPGVWGVATLTVDLPPDPSADPGTDFLPCIGEKSLPLPWYSGIEVGVWSKEIPPPWALPAVLEESSLGECGSTQVWAVQERCPRNVDGRRGCLGSCR